MYPSPLHVNKVVLQRLLGNGTLADLQFGGRIVVDVVDAHLVADGESPEGGGLVILRIVVASGHQGVALKKTNGRSSG